MDTGTLPAVVREGERWAPRLWRLLFHPRLKLLFDPTKTFTTAGHTQHPGRTAKYVHLVCRNVSWLVAARGCRAYLRAVLRDSLAGPGPVAGFTGPVPLRWANTPEQGPFAHQAAEIRRGEDYRIDLGYQLQGDTAFHLYLPQEFVGVQKELPPGAYFIDVEVQCANELRGRINRRFQLVVGPTWGGITLIAQ